MDEGNAVDIMAASRLPSPSSVTSHRSVSGMRSASMTSQGGTSFNAAAFAVTQLAMRTNSETSLRTTLARQLSTRQALSAGGGPLASPVSPSADMPALANPAAGEESDENARDSPPELDKEGTVNMGCRCIIC